MEKEPRVLANADIEEVVVAAPEGHRHLRTTLKLTTGESIVLQEATVANLVRAYVTIKTHPQKDSVRLAGQKLGMDERKQGYAAWQLLDVESEA